MAAWGRWGTAWELKFIKDEIKIVWPFLAGFGIWNYVIFKHNINLQRPDFEGSKFYQRNKWRDIKNQKFNLEEALARASGEMRLLDMESYCRFADKCWNYLYWNDARPEWSELQYSDGEHVRLEWPAPAFQHATYAEHRRPKPLFAEPNRKMFAAQDHAVNNYYSFQAKMMREYLVPHHPERLQRESTD